MWLVLLAFLVSSSVLENGAVGEKHLIETMVGGVAVLDFDGDGRLDYYVTNGAPIPSLRKTGERYWNRLYRNVGQQQFVDATAEAGVAGTGYDIGATTGDYDGDGRTDLFVAGVRGMTLFRNLGTGKFADVSRTAGLPTSAPWSVGGGFFDMDKDGDLDLFVVRYVDWDPAKEKACEAGVRTYCHPREYTGLPNALYRNDGNGHFTDVSLQSGIANHRGKGMAVAFGDLDADGLLDVFVTNDTEPNFLFRNLGGGRFEEIGGRAGVAFNDDGRALSSMGADFRDWDNDGREDLFVTALTNETFPLFRNGGGRWIDRTYASLVGRNTLARSGWSAGIYDFDNDGWKDLFAACSDVQDNTEKYSGRASRQRNVWLRNSGNGTFAAIEIGSSAMHRGAAFGDLDGDGDIDAVVTRIGDTPWVWWNDAAKGRWLRVRLRGRGANRDGYGALVKVELADGSSLWNRVGTAVGYASASEVVAHFGLGVGTVKAIEVRWQSGTVTRRDIQTSNQVLEIEEGARPE